MEKTLPAIPAKRYFTIGEVSELCGVKPYVLRYWEQEFTQLKPMKRRGNRRYYQHHEVLLIRRIRELLYEQGFTISGARNRLTDVAATRHETPSRSAAEPGKAQQGAVSEGEPRDAASDAERRGVRAARVGDAVVGAGAPGAALDPRLARPVSRRCL
jgi:DNA-binding transcriptional MerR regulator